MTDRDTLAAAALTGLLHHDAAIARDSTMARKAYEIADAMLAERLRNGAVSTCETVPDPNSRVWITAERAKLPQSHEKCVEKRVDEHMSGEPVAWAVMSNAEVHRRLYETELQASDAARIAGNYGHQIPLYAHPPQVVRLPRLPTDFDISEANGYWAATADICKALDAAGVKWEVAE